MRLIDDIVQKIRRTILGHGENNLTSRKSFEEVYNDLGAFKYTKDGFIIHYEDFQKQFKWKDITELNAYKKDLGTIDTIAVQVVYGDKQIEITEELPGWFQFIKKTKEVFSLSDAWYAEITHPPFATNFTQLYKRNK